MSWADIYVGVCNRVSRYRIKLGKRTQKKTERRIKFQFTGIPFLISELIRRTMEETDGEKLFGKVNRGLNKGTRS